MPRGENAKVSLESIRDLWKLNPGGRLAEGVHELRDAVKEPGR